MARGKSGCLMVGCAMVIDNWLIGPDLVVGRNRGDVAVAVQLLGEETVLVER
jgi:hypothetical protein